MRTDRSVRGLPGIRRISRPATKCELDFDFVLGDRIACLNPDHWDALTEGQSLFLSRTYRSMMEDEGPRSIQARYGMIYSNDTPVAAVLASIKQLPERRVPVEGPKTRRGAVYTMLDNTEDTPKELHWAPASRNVMVCGDFYVGGLHGIAVRDERDLGKLWPAVALLLHKIQLQEGHAREKDYILIKDVPASLAAATRALRLCQYRRVDTSPNMVLELSPRWKTYDDYLAQLNVRYRLSAVRAARDLLRQGFELRPLEAIAPWSARMHELYLQVQRRSGADFVPLPQPFLQMLAARLDVSQFRCSGLFKDDGLMGFALTLKDRDTAVCFCIGWDIDACQQVMALPSLLHAVIDHALAMECRQINFGRTALRAKAQLGAHPEQSELWIHHARLELNLSMTALLDTLSHAPYGDQATPLPL